MFLFTTGCFLLILSFITLAVNFVLDSKPYLLLLGQITLGLGVLTAFLPLLIKMSAYIVSIPLEENFILVGLAIYTLCFLGVKLYMKYNKDHKYNRTM